MPNLLKVRTLHMDYLSQSVSHEDYNIDLHKAVICGIPQDSPRSPSETIVE